MRTCDSCGGELTRETGRDVFFVVRLQITKATAWTADERRRAADLVTNVRKLGDARLADELAKIEPAEIIGDKAPNLMTHADLRICPDCVQQGRTLNLIDLIRATEFPGTPRVPSS